MKVMFSMPDTGYLVFGDEIRYRCALEAILYKELMKGLITFLSCDWEAD